MEIDQILDDNIIYRNKIQLNILMSDNKKKRGVNYL